MGCSVVIVTYNSMKTIEDCLLSLGHHLREGDEVIVVDNNSEDGTQQFLLEEQGKLHQSTLILNPFNLGFSRASNLGCAASKSEFVCFLNPDTAIYKDCLDNLCKSLRSGEFGASGPVSNCVAGDQFYRTISSSRRAKGLNL